MRSKLFWKLFLGNAVLMTAMLVTCIWLITGQVDELYQEDLTTSLRAQAGALAELLTDQFDAAHAPRLQEFAREMGRNDPVGVRITLIARNGVVLADSIADPHAMELHHTHSEVRQAMETGWGEESRRSTTLGAMIKYVAVRVGPQDAPLGVVRVAMPLRTVRQHSDSIHRLIWGTATIALVTALAFALGLAALWSVPIRQITLTARQLSRGDLSARVKVMGNDEIAALGHSLNQMRDSLVDQIEMVDRQRELLVSLLDRLRDSVIVAGPDGRIVLMNLAAHRLLGLIDAEGRPVPVKDALVGTCVPHPQLQRLLLWPSAEANMPVQQIRLEQQNGDLALLASTSPILLPGNGINEQAQTTGRLLVLTDVTPLTRTIQVKADFAANASHELRTPLSAIRAAVETLQQIDPSLDRDRYDQFLNVIERHSSRMEAMVADLLNLSRIETSPSRFKPSVINLSELLDELRERMADRLEARQLNWITQLPESRREIMANPHLLQLVLENLVDNAIKFTDPGGQIRISCGAELDKPGEPVTFEMVDNGCGISPEDQERVFERFYQVERARSGTERGTGLGLSIVRHAVAAMHGTVKLTSQLGQGTTVAFTIPQAE